MLKYLNRLLQDVDGLPSSKRVVVLMFTILFFIVTIANIFYGLKVDSNIYYSLVEVMCAGLGFTGLEKFTNRSPGNNEN